MTTHDRPKKSTTQLPIVGHSSAKIQMATGQVRRRAIAHRVAIGDLHGNEFDCDLGRI